MSDSPKKLKLVTTGGNSSNPQVFDDRPIDLPGWQLRHRTALPKGKPTPDDTANALAFASASHESSPYWVGDIMRYSEDRADYAEKLSQIVAATGLAEQTVYNLTSIARNVQLAERELSPSVTHSGIVAKLKPEEQRRWLKKAVREGWGKRELTQELNAAQKRGVIEGTAELEGMFRVWLVDCPWLYNQAEPSKVSAQSRYPGMTVDQLIAMSDQVKAHTTRQAVGFFWVTAPMLYYATEPEKGPDPYRVMRAWGFEPKTGGVWDKVAHNFGHYLSIRHEHLLIGTRGSCTPDHPTPMLDSIFVERKSDVHSEKPKTAYKYIERLYDGKKVELFARAPRRGWTTWGNQVNSKILDKERAG